MDLGSGDGRAIIVAAKRGTPGLGIEWNQDLVDLSNKLAAAAGLNRTKGFQPIRAAVTGSTVSPPLPESLELLGRERAIERLRSAS